LEFSDTDCYGFANSGRDSFNSVRILAVHWNHNGNIPDFDSGKHHQVFNENNPLDLEPDTVRRESYGNANHAHT
jgi:hypothetical protein